MNPHEISKEQYDVWHKHYRELLSAMKFVPPLDRERAMLYLLETMLLRVRLSIGLGDPGHLYPMPPKKKTLKAFAKRIRKHAGGQRSPSMTTLKPEKT